MKTLSPRRFASCVKKMLRGGNSVQEWREHLMKASTADFLLNEDPVVESLQTTIAKLDEGVSFATAFAGLVSYFAVPYQDKDLFRCLRASVQILVIYSITSGDHRWIRSPAARELGRLGTELGTSIVTPLPVTEAPLEDGSTPMDRFAQLTYLLDAVAKLTVLRAKIIHHLYTLATLIPPTAPFRHYDQSNTYHTWSAANLLTKLYPDSNYMVGMAFALVVNPATSSDLLCQDVPPVYCPNSESEKPLVEV